MGKKFISIIWGYHRQIFSFDKKQNYHMLPLEAMQEEGFDCEIFAIDSEVQIQEDPNFIKGVKVIYYKNVFEYLYYLFKNRREIIYSNSLTIKTLLVGLIGKKTVFMAHDQVLPLETKKMKREMVLFFYKFFSFIRVINSGEYRLLHNESIHSHVLPLSISDEFYSENTKRDNLIFVGNLYFDKNPGFLLETMRSVLLYFPNISLHIYGEDRYNDNGKNFQDVVNEYGLAKNIIVHGFVPHNELKEVFQHSLIYINTSISEGQCLAVYEAGLSGCVLCLQNILSFPSVFGDQALYHDTHEDLSKNIIQVLNNKHLFLDIVKRNQKMILEKYNYNYIKNQTKEMFLKLN